MPIAKENVVCVVLKQQRKVKKHPTRLSIYEPYPTSIFAEAGTARKGLALVLIYTFSSVLALLQGMLNLSFSDHPLSYW